MANRLSIKEVKDHLASVVAEIEATGQAVVITRSGKPVARIVPVETAGVVLGLGRRPGIDAPTVEELRWSDEDLASMCEQPIEPM